MAGTELDQLHGTSNFRVFVGKTEIGVSSVSRITSEAPVDPVSGKRADRFATVVLRRALSRATDLYDWRRAVAAGKPDRRQVLIQQLDAPAGGVVNAWRLEGAWPCRWSGPDFDALAADVACEELELAFDDVTWLPPPAELPTIAGPAPKIPAVKPATRTTTPGG